VTGSTAPAFRLTRTQSTTPTDPNPFKPAQACSWRFLAFSGSFNVHLAVEEDAAARALVFKLIKSSFMRDFEGRWLVTPAPSSSSSSSSSSSGSSDGGSSGRSRVEHVLAVEPIVPMPAAISRYTKGIFTRQVANILRDLEREIAAQTAQGGK
jgi:hypothetical protein